MLRYIPRNHAGGNRKNRTTGVRGVHIWKNQSGTRIPKICFALHDEKTMERHEVRYLCPTGTPLKVAVNAVKLIQRKARDGEFADGYELDKFVAKLKAFMRSQYAGRHVNS